MARRKSGFKRFIVGAVVVLLAATAGGAIVKACDNAKEDTKTLKTRHYNIGVVEEDGDFKKDEKKSLVSDFVNADGLVIDIQDEDVTVTYKVHYYNENEEFISSTDVMTEDYVQGELDETAKLARVEITPTEDDKITIFEKSGYVGQVSVTVNK